MRQKLAGMCAIAALALTGCATPSDADDTACKIFNDANSRLNTAINTWVTDGKSEKGSDIVRSENARLPKEINEASQIATGDLAVMMRNAAEYVAAGTEDGDTAYYMVIPDIYQECKSLGVKLDIVEMDIS